MRIAVFHNLPSGGAKRALNEATKRLVADHSVDVYTLSSANHDFADLRPYVVHHHVFDFRPLPLFSSPFGRFNQAIRLIDLKRLRSVAKFITKEIERNNYDVVLVHPCQFEKAPTILSYLQKPPSVYYCHEPLRLLYEEMPDRPYNRGISAKRQILERLDPLPGLYYAALRQTDQGNTRRAGMVLVNSEFTREAVNRIYAVDAQVSYLGVDTQLFRPLSLEKQHMLLSVGSLTPLKGFDFLIQAVACIPVHQRPALVVVSNFQNPPEKAYLEQLALQSQVDLKLLVNVSDDKLVEFYNRAKVTVYAPIREPFGFVPLESMACGTPVVAVREGGMKETVNHEHTGLLVERDPAQFAGQIQRLLDCPKLAAEYGANGREYALNHWTWDVSVANLEKQLATCL